MNDKSHAKQKKKTLLLGASAVLAASLIMAGCASKEDKARENLAKLSIAYTPDSFVQAAANNDQKALQLFLDAGMTPDTKDANDETALMSAAQKGNTDAIDLLLKAKTNVNAVSSKGETALSHAVEASQLRAVQQLLDNGANANLLAGDTTLLVLAVRSGNVEIVKLLLDKGADPNKLSNGVSALSEAVQKGLSGVVALLLDAKADPNVKTIDGKSLIVYTLDKEQPENAKKLVEHGANPQEKLEKGATLLTYAKLRGYEDVAELLIQKGAKEASLLTFQTVEQTDGIYPPQYPLAENVLNLGANESYQHPKVTYDLGGKASRFTASFANNHPPSTFIEYPYNVQLIVEGDGKKLYEGKSLGMGAQAESIDLDVTGVKQLTIKVEANKYFGLYDSKGVLQSPIVVFP